MWRQGFRIKLGFCFFLLILSSCVSPAAPPAPLAEIPDTLLVPQDLSIDINEAQGSGSASGIVFGSLGKAQSSVSSEDIANAIQVAGGTFEENNFFLDGSLSVVNQREIPVEVSVFNFAYATTVDGQNVEIKFDFGIFDLDGDGAAEACTGCTCPIACLPTLSECPSEAPEEQLKPICFRVWVNNQRFMAGLFDRVPTPENPESGRFRIIFLEPGDLAGSNMGILYDHRDSESLSTDLSWFVKDPNVGDDFFASRHAMTTQVGPPDKAKKTPRLDSEILDSTNSRLRFQAQFLADSDFILLESIPEGKFMDVLGLVPITPPICAQISSADAVAQVLCDDLGLALTAGNFPPPAEFSDVAPPPFEQFPESPTF